MQNAPGQAGAAGGLDVLSKNIGEHVRKVQGRELATNVVVGLFRLVKLSTLHSLDNQAMIRQVEETTQAVHEYCLRTEHNVSLLFAHGSVFVGGQLLRANRSVYDGAVELGNILARVGAAEIGIRREVGGADFLALASALADALRKPKPPRIERPSPNIRLRGLAASALLRENIASERVDPTVQVARTYASAVVIMRRFFEDLRKGRYELPQRVKRVAQRLVDLSNGETPAFLGVTAARNQNHDEAGRAVNTAILALAMARQMSTDLVQLSRVAMAALLYDCARARIAGVVGMPAGGIMPRLSDQQEDESAAGTAVVLTALGRINEPSVMRTVISYEAHWQRRRAQLGPVYRGLRAPSLQARLINVARAFNDMLTPASGQPMPSADEAIGRLEHMMTEAADRTVIRLLVGALGIFTTGTIVRLTSGETGIVVQTPSHPAQYSQPRVRLVLDARGGFLKPPIELDLAHQRPGEMRHIGEVVATSDDPAGAEMRAYAARSEPMNPPSAQSGLSGASFAAVSSPSRESRESQRVAPMTPAPEANRYPPAPDANRYRSIPPSFDADSRSAASRALVPPHSPLRTPTFDGEARSGTARAPMPPHPAPASPAYGARVPAMTPDGRRGSSQMAQVTPTGLRGPSAPMPAMDPRSPYAQESELEPYEAGEALDAGFDESLLQDASDDAADEGTTRQVSPEERRRLLASLPPHRAEQATAREEELARELAREPSAPPSSLTSPRPTTSVSPVGPRPAEPRAPTRVPVVTGSAEGGASKPLHASSMASVASMASGAAAAPTGGSEAQHPAKAVPPPRPAPTAEGSLAKTPFVHLLIYMLDQRLSGTTVLSVPTPHSTSIEHAIYFHDGAPAKVRTGTMLQPLDRILVDEGWLDDATLRGTLMEVSKRNILHGRLLVMKGLLDRTRVLQALSMQVRRKVTGLFDLPPETTYAYYADHNLLSSYGGPELTPTEPLAVIMAGIRLMGADPIVEATLARVASRPLSLHIDADPKRMQLLRDEQAVVDLLRARATTIGDLVQGGVAQESVIQQVIYALVVTRQVDLGAGRTPVGLGRPIVEPGTVVLDTSAPDVPMQAGPTSEPPVESTPSKVAPSTPITSVSPTAAPPMAHAPSAPVAHAPPSPHAPPVAVMSSRELLSSVQSGQAQAQVAPTTHAPPPPSSSSPVPPASPSSLRTSSPLRPPAPHTSSGLRQPAAPPPPRAPMGSDSATFPTPPPSSHVTPQAHSAPPSSSPTARSAGPQRPPPPPAPATGRPRTTTLVSDAPETMGNPERGFPKPLQGSSGSPLQGSSGSPLQGSSGSPLQGSSGYPHQASSSPEGYYTRQPSVPPAPPSSRMDPSSSSRMDPPSSSRMDPPSSSRVEGHHGSRAAPPPPPRRAAPPPAPSSSQAAPPPSSSQAPPRGSAPSVAPPPPARASAGGPPRPSGARRTEIEKRASTLDTDDFYQVLGVPAGSAPDAVKTAYFGLAKSWHPDRLPPDLLDLKPTVARIFAKISEAYQTLSDPAAATAYAASLQEGTAGREEQAQVARVVDAALEFQKAEILMRKNDIAGAEQLVSRAAAADPEQPEYATLLAWIKALRRGDPPELREGQTTTHFDDLIKILDGILAKEARFERALYYRGVLLKRSGRVDRAIRDFRLAADINPKNLDAVREVRLYEMRKRAAPGAKDKAADSQDGLFGKLFKR